VAARRTHREHARPESRRGHGRRTGPRHEAADRGPDARAKRRCSRPQRLLSEDPQEAPGRAPACPERHRAGYRWRERFPDAAPVLHGEGGLVYAAEAGRALSGDWRREGSGVPVGRRRRGAGGEPVPLHRPRAVGRRRRRFCATPTPARSTASRRRPGPARLTARWLISSTAPHTGSSASPASSSSSRSTSNRTCSPRARRSRGASPTSGTTIRRSRRRPGSRSKRGAWGTSTSLSSRPPARRGRSSNSMRGRAGRHAPSETISSCSTGRS
jgi:hypothetical protein